jgi:hypothetical protein
MLTDEQKAEIDAKLDAIFNKPIRPKPKVVTSDGDVVRDANVVVSPADPNAKHGADGVVSVRAPEPQWLRHDTVRINMQLAERQWEDRQRDEARDRQGRQQLRQSDPMGVWGNSTGDEEYRNLGKSQRQSFIPNHLR